MVGIEEDQAVELQVEVEELLAEVVGLPGAMGRGGSLVAIAEGGLGPSASTSSPGATAGASG